MNSFRFSGSTVVETCSAEITVALDDEDVEAGLDCHLVVVADFLRASRSRETTAARRLDFLDPPADQLRLDRPPCRSPASGASLRAWAPRRSPRGALRRFSKAAPDALQVEHAEGRRAWLVRAAVLGRDHAVHGGGEQGQVEAVRTEGPGDVDVVGVPACGVKERSLRRRIHKRAGLSFRGRFRFPKWLPPGWW